MPEQIPPITNKIHVSGYENGYSGRKIVVMREALPENIQSAVAAAIGSGITRIGTPEYYSTQSLASFKSPSGFGDATYGVMHEATQEGIPQLKLLYAPYEYRAASTRVRGNRSNHQPQTPLTVIFKDIPQAQGLFDALKQNHEQKRRERLASDLREADIDVSRIDISAVSEMLVETVASIRTRGAIRTRGETESVDSMLQEFSDTAIDYTETERSPFSLERRWEVEARDYFKDEAEEAAELAKVRSLLYDETGALQHGNIENYHFAEPTEGPFIELKGHNGIRIRIERQPGGEKTKLVKITPTEKLPLEITGIRGLRDFFTNEILGGILPQLERKAQAEKVMWGIDNLAEVLEKMDFPSRRTFVERDKLLELILS